MKNLILIFIFFVSLFSFSQVSFNDEVDITNFPTISFEINNRNPNVIGKSSFVFNESIDGEIVESELVKFEVIPDTSSYENYNKCVLILIEILLHESRKEQNITFLSSIDDILEKVVNKGDEFMIATFAVTYSNDNKIIKQANTSFTDDVKNLKKDLKQHISSITLSEFNKKPVSNIYDAVIEGVDLLDLHESSLPKSILILSEERHNIKITNKSLEAIQLSNDKGIVINSVKYNQVKNYQHSISNLVDQTFGTRKILTKTTENLYSLNIDKKNEASSFIKEILSTTVKRSKGVNYNISLQLQNQLRDGKKRKLHLKVDDSDKIYKLSYKPPGNWVFGQFQTNLLQSIIVTTILLVLLTLSIRLILKKQKDKRNKEMEMLEIQKEKELVQAQLIPKKNLKKLKERKRIEIENNKKLKEEEERLINEMMTLGNGSFPILKFVDNENKTLKFSINKPVLTVGRDVNNIVVINNNNISRNHFKIIFENNEYSIVDNNSTNGIILNGKRIKKSSLNNTDIIQIADVTFTFYN